MNSLSDDSRPSNMGILAFAGLAGDEDRGVGARGYTQWEHVHATA